MGLAALLLSVSAAQTLSTLPPDAPLRQIKTERFIIIYPEDAEAPAGIPLSCRPPTHPLRGIGAAANMPC